MATDLIKQIVSLYLYGSNTMPGELVNESLIRSDSATVSVMLDAAPYMTNGGGRFAKPCQFDVVTRFFDSDIVLGEGS